MNNQPDPYAEVQSKLRKGIQILREASPQDSDRLGMALLKFHSALEDFIRLEVASKAGYSSERVMDVRQTSWKDLLEFASAYLKFSDYDCRVINDANALRLKVAHGREYFIRRDDLVKYAGFVLQKCNPRQPLPDLSYQAPAAPVPAPDLPPVTFPQPSKRISSSRKTTPSSTEIPYPVTMVYRRPWYRSTVFLVFAFFFMPPLWALLMITDRSQGCLTKGLGYSILIVLFIACLGIFSPSSRSLEALQDLIREAGATRTVQQEPAAGMEPPAIVEATTFQPANSSVTASGCVLVWVEVPADRLAARNRSMVWEEIVMEQVRGSGMTDRQFYDQVVEKNPVLKTDGYEFKKGKTYLLPECQ